MDVGRKYRMYRKYRLMDCGWKYIKYKMRHFDETLRQDIFMRQLNKTFWEDILMPFEKVWWPVMTFDMVWFDIILMEWPYDSFDCLLL